MEFFHGFKRMVALVTVFFMPEIVELIGTRVLFNSSFVKKVFWDAMESREKTGMKRGDFIDSLVQLKNGEQSQDYSTYFSIQNKKKSMSEDKSRIKDDKFYTRKKNLISSPEAFRF